MQDTAVNPAYVAAERARALRTLAAHADPVVRARAAERVRRWDAVAGGMAQGSLAIGSRTPVLGVPAWATLEVVHGGFATGALLAEGPLEPDEEAQLTTIPGEGSPHDRLHAWVLSEAGRATLLERLRDGTYRIAIPEDAALATVAWLLDRGAVDAALDVVEAIGPWLGRLRFTPRAAETPLSSGVEVHRESAHEVAARLRERRERPQIVAMNETLGVWRPLEDRGLALILETVAGAPPRVAEGAPRRPDGQLVIEGGWPLGRSPEGWHARAQAWLDAVASARADTTVSRAKQVTSTLGRLLMGITAGVRGLSPSRAELGALRRAIAGALHKRGPLYGEALRAQRAEQAAVAARPTHGALARVLAARLAALPPDVGIPATAPFAAPVSAAELPRAAGALLPDTLLGRLALCLDATVEAHVASGALPSAETLAQVLPQLTAAAMTTSIEDPALRRLYAATYAAFRRRRSLLLLHLEGQVRFDELPWVAAVAPYQARSPDGSAAARVVLADVSALALTGFPMTLLPNPLVAELGALATAAGLALPLVEEIAADIFMGTFTPKFAEAARRTSELLHGRLYGRYYDLRRAAEYDGGSLIERWGRRADEGFAAHCRARAREAGWTEQRGVANNGTVLEQAQILTSHNLAVLVAGLGLADALTPRASATTCIDWIVARYGQAAPDPHTALLRRKDTAYAWRQMVFFLSFLREDSLGSWLHTHRERVIEVPYLTPAWVGLEGVARGERFDAAGRLGEGQRLLGWRARRE